MPREIEQKIPDLKDRLDHANQQQLATVEVQRGELNYLFRNYENLVEIVELSLVIRTRRIELVEMEEQLDDLLRTFRYLDSAGVQDTDPKPGGISPPQPSR